MKGIEKMKLRLLMLVLAALSSRQTWSQTTPSTVQAEWDQPLLVVARTEMQPSNTLIPIDARRLPFTRLIFTAYGERRVDVENLVVERQGLSVDYVLDSVVALDERGLELGDERWLNSNHQAVLNTRFSLEPGESKIITLAGNRPSWGSASHHGMQVRLALVAVQASTTCGGVFPIVGATHTINEGLAIGTVTTRRGLFDTGMSSAYYVGTSNITASSVQFFAGLEEGGVFRGIRWHQSGTAILGDYTAQTYINGRPYTTTVSADGRYYTTLVSPGIQWGQGSSIDVSVRVSLLNGAGRTVNLDIQSRADVYIRGSAYGFDIVPEYEMKNLGVPDNATVEPFDDPYYDGAKLTILSGEIIIRASAYSPSQDILSNTASQLLGGGFLADVRGESIIVRNVGFNVSLQDAGGGSDVDELTGIVLVDATGAVVSGPVNGIASDSHLTAGWKDGSVIFRNVTFPAGLHWYTLRGTAGSRLPYGTVIQFSTTPSMDFGPARGLTTDAYITIRPAFEMTLSSVIVKETFPSLPPRVRSIEFSDGILRVIAQVPPNQMFGLDWSDDLVNWVKEPRSVQASQTGQWVLGTEFIVFPTYRFFRVSSR